MLNGALHYREGADERKDGVEYFPNPKIRKKFLAKPVVTGLKPLCVLCVPCVSVVSIYLGFVRRRDTENTKVAKRKIATPTHNSRILGTSYLLKQDSLKVFYNNQKAAKLGCYKYSLKIFLATYLPIPILVANEGYTGVKPNNHYEDNYGDNDRIVTF